MKSGETMQDSERAQEAKCGLCGEPMPEGEEMFKFHGYSGGCPKPPLAEVAKYLGSMLAVDPPPSGASLKRRDPAASNPLNQVFTILRDLDMPEDVRITLAMDCAEQAILNESVVSLATGYAPDGRPLVNCVNHPQGDHEWACLACLGEPPDDSAPSGASPQATGGYIHHSLTDWIPTPGCDCDRCTSARKSAPKPTGGASSQAETVAKLLLAARQVASFARAWEPLSPGDIRDLTKAIEAMDALPAPVSPVEPEPPTLEPCAHELDYHNCAECVGPKVEPEPPTTCRCLDCEPLADPGPKPSEDDINRLEKAAWDSKTDRVLVWYRDRAEMFRQRLRETERAWQLDRKKPTVEPEPCVWREKYNELLFAVERAYPGESRHETALRYIREKETVESCAPKAPLKVEREP